MRITLREYKDGPVLMAELTPEEINTIMWAIEYSENNDAEKLREDLCGMESVAVRFDGRGKNGL